MAWGSLLPWTAKNQTMALVGGGVREMSPQNPAAGQPRHD
jgi:hypothetical protein